MAGSTLLPFVVGDVPPIGFIVECKVSHFTLVCIASCHARIIYIHSRSIGIFRACIHLGVHDHHVTNDTCRQSLDMAYECITNEVLKIPTAKDSAIVMAASKQFLADYLFKSSANVEDHHLVGLSLVVVMVKSALLRSRIIVILYLNQSVFCVV